MKALVVSMLVAIAACGASARDKALNAAYATNQGAEAALHAYDMKHQVDIANLDKASGREKTVAQADLIAWQAERNKIDQDIAGVYRAIAAAATINNDSSLSGVYAAAQIVAQELRALGVIP